MMTTQPDLQARAKVALARTLATVESEPPADADPETLRQLERAVQAMPRLRRQIFLAHRLDGLSYADIAERTGLSVGQVERHMARALRDLSRYLSGDDRSAWRRWWERSRSWFG